MMYEDDLNVMTMFEQEGFEAEINLHHNSDQSKIEKGW